MRRLLRFRLRTLFLAVAVAAGFLAWRLHDAERSAVEAIAKAGGRVHFNYQSPSPSWSWFSVGMLPEYIYFSQVRVTRHGPAAPPRPRMLDLLLGSADHHVVLVELRLEDMSPTLVEHLKSLKHLRTIVLDMPAGVISNDSPEARRLSELKKPFGGRLYPAYNRGLEPG